MSFSIILHDPRGCDAGVVRQMRGQINQHRRQLRWRCEGKESNYCNGLQASNLLAKQSNLDLLSGCERLRLSSQVNLSS